MMSPHCTTASNVTLENSFSLSLFFFFYNAIQVLLDIPKRSLDAKPWVLIELGAGPQLVSAGTPRSDSGNVLKWKLNTFSSPSVCHLWTITASHSYNAAQIDLNTFIFYSEISARKILFFCFPLHLCIVVLFHLIPRFCESLMLCL